MNSIGVYFTVSQDNDLKIESLLRFFNIEAYSWHITTNDVMVRNDDWKHSFLEDEEFVSGIKLKEELQKKEIVPIFLNLRAYPKGISIDDVQHTPLTNLQEFIHSKCVLMLVIIDCYEVAIFVKDSSYLANLEQEILLQGYSKFRFIKPSEAWHFN
jgi:hypothetical protein